MFPIGLLKAVASTVRDHEPVVGVRRRLYDRRFARTSGWHNLARGLYGSFAEARGDAPATMPVGYVLDDDAYARHATIEAHDYPALFWLRAARRRRGGSWPSSPPWSRVAARWRNGATPRTSRLSRTRPPPDRSTSS